MPPFWRIRSLVLCVALTGLAVGAIGSGILQATGEWDVGKFLGRFQSGATSGAIVGVVLILSEVGRLRKFQSGTLANPEAPFASLPGDATIVTTPKTLMWVSLVWSGFIVLSVATDYLQIFGWSLGLGLVYAVSHKLLTNWELHRGVELFQERRLWSGWKGPQYYIRGLRMA